MKKNCIFAENLSDIRLIQLMKDAVMTKYNIIEKKSILNLSLVMLL